MMVIILWLLSSISCNATTTVPGYSDNFALGGEPTTHHASITSSHIEDKTDRNLATLVSMGFEDTSKCINALETCENNLQPAINLMLEWSTDELRRKYHIGGRRRKSSSGDRDKDFRTRFGFRSPDGHEQLRTLRAMGFLDVNANFEALKTAEGNFELAVNKLVSDRRREDAMLHMSNLEIEGMRYTPEREKQMKKLLAIRRERERERFKRQEAREARLKRGREEVRRNMTNLISQLEEEKKLAVSWENFTLAEMLRRRIHILKHRLDPKNFDANVDAVVMRKEIDMLARDEVALRFFETLMASFGKHLLIHDSSLIIPLYTLPLCLKPISKLLADNPGILANEEKFYSTIREALKAATIVPQHRGSIQKTTAKEEIDEADQYEENKGKSNESSSSPSLRGRGKSDEEVVFDAVEASRLALLENYAYIRGNALAFARKEIEEDLHVRRRRTRRQMSGEHYDPTTASERELVALVKCEANRVMSLSGNEKDNPNRMKKDGEGLSSSSSSTHRRIEAVRQKVIAEMGGGLAKKASSSSSSSSLFPSYSSSSSINSQPSSSSSSTWRQEINKMKEAESKGKLDARIRQRRYQSQNRRLLRERQAIALKGYLNAAASSSSTTNAFYSSSNMGGGMSKNLQQQQQHIDVLSPPFDVKSMDGSQTLIKEVELKLSFGRRYGLVARNGMGKTTLMRMIADYQIKGIPKQMRILLIEQELEEAVSIPSSSSTTSSASNAEGRCRKTVLQRVLEADYERELLLKEEKRLLLSSSSKPATILSSSENDNDHNKRDDDDDDDDGEYQDQEETLIDLWGEGENGYNSKLSNDEKLSVIYERMAEINVDDAEHRASKILCGLGFTAKMQRLPMSTLSGGWLMRVSLARGLFVQPELLLLDEPTNHLDMPSIMWLQEYLNNYPSTVVLVSHDKDFLNKITTDILHIDSNQKLTSYRGNYETFLRTRSSTHAQQAKLYMNQKHKREKLLEYISKNSAKSHTAKMANSRKKMLHKMEEVDEIQKEKRILIQLPPASSLSTKEKEVEYLLMKRVSFRYSPESPLLISELELKIRPTTRLAILGANGVGKTTILRLLIGTLSPISGSITRNERVKLAYFAQHHSEILNMSSTPIEYLFQQETKRRIREEEYNIVKGKKSTSRSPSRTNSLPLQCPSLILQGGYKGREDKRINEEFDDEKQLKSEIRSHLGRFGISQEKQSRPIENLSGGERSRVAFAHVTFQRPHILILDEPTNHLDIDTIEAFTQGLENWEGSIIVVSHNQNFAKRIASEFLALKAGESPKYFTSLAKAKRHALSGSAIAFQPSPKNKNELMIKTEKVVQKKQTEQQPDKLDENQMALQHENTNQFTTGQLVKVKGLRGEKYSRKAVGLTEAEAEAKSLNGQIGKIIRFDPNLGRYLVRVAVAQFDEHSKLRSKFWKPKFVERMLALKQANLYAVIRKKKKKKEKNEN